MKRPLLTFFLATYAAAWTCWSAARAVLPVDAPAAPGRAAAASALFLLGTFAPGLVALILTALGEGSAAARRLLARIGQWDVSLRYYVFAIAYMPGIKLSVAVAHRIATGAWPQFGPEAWYVMAGAILISTWVQAGEEIGWRGYALPRLSDRCGLAAASVLLGIVWAAWHLPLFFVRAADTFGQSFPLYLLQVTAVSIASAWLYWRTAGSLLLVMLLHAAINNTKDIVPSAVPGATNPFALSTSLAAWLTLTMMWIVGVFFLARMHASRLPAAKAVTV